MTQREELNAMIQKFKAGKTTLYGIRKELEASGRHSQEAINNLVKLCAMLIRF